MDRGLFGFIRQFLVAKFSEVRAGSLMVGIMLAQIPQPEERKEGDEDVESKTGRAAPSQGAVGLQASVDRSAGTRAFGSARDGDRRLRC
jgi:hypothetical protein